MTSLESSGFAEAIEAFAAAESAVESQARAVVERGAVNIKKQLQRELGGSRHFKGIARDVSYDIRTAGAFGGGVIEAEIGPESGPGRAGNLANVAYFGTSRGGGTVPDPSLALAAEVPKFERELARLVGEGL